MNVSKKSSILIVTLLLFVGVACNRNEEPYFSFDGATSFVLSPTDTTLLIKVESNVEWTLVSDAAWCVPHMSEGTGSAEISVSVVANDEQGERSAVLTLNCVEAAFTQSINVSQQRLTPDATTMYRLPVVFHVLYKSNTSKQQNVVKGHLATLIDAVNEVYANCGVELGLEFVMATHDPEGNLLEEPGVDRHKINEASLNSSYFMGYGRDPKKYCQYMWDPNRYINIFVYTFEDKGILGISHFPYVIKPHALEGLTELEFNADWSELPWPQCVSINNEYIYSHEAYYTITDVVNTLAHELGHFLGLRHAFSEDPVTYDCDICFDSDFCTDTPTYNKAEYDALVASMGVMDKEKENLLMMRDNCETGEEFRSTNIMDYAYTEANRFSPQQVARIRYVLEHSPYIPGPKVRLPEQQASATKSARKNQYVLKTFE